MTDNEIIKALEYCSKQGVTSECERCKVPKGCRPYLISKAIDLINRQKAEIEKLKKRHNRLCVHTQKIEMELVETKQDISWFEKPTVHTHAPVVRQIEAEAIKEFADRLKSYLNQDDFGTPDERWKPESEFATLIDILVKEMVGDNDAE